MTSYDHYISPLGKIILATDGKSITDCRFAGQKYFEKIPTAWIKSSNNQILKNAIQQILEYFMKNRTIFTLAISAVGTPFQKQVWNAISKIPYGQTANYKSIAEKIGTPKSVRAVATAIGKNPLCIIVPCHRVIGTDGSLTGYAGGLWRKKWLLEHESPSAQQSLF